VALLAWNPFMSQSGKCRDTCIEQQKYPQPMSTSMSLKLLSLIGGIMIVAAAASSAFAGDEPEVTGPEFRMPSGNIACKVQKVGALKQLFCVRNLPRTIAVVLGKGGLTSSPTDGDQPFNEDAPVLEYGDNFENGGFWCDSGRDGLLCTHNSYGGFTLSRKGLKEIKNQ
jgi:hypothetical protein